MENIKDKIRNIYYIYNHQILYGHRKFLISIMESGNPDLIL